MRDGEQADPFLRLGQHIAAGVERAIRLALPHRKRLPGVGVALMIDCQIIAVTAAQQLGADIALSFVEQLCPIAVSPIGLLELPLARRSNSVASDDRDHGFLLLYDAHEFHSMSARPCRLPDFRPPRAIHR